MSVDPASSATHTSPRWQPLEAIDRRILGVLIEKAKTTPENYPLSLNAIRSAANQKSNRSPMMQLEEPQIEESLEKLRHLGAVAQVQGTSRVDRYRHLAYDWLGVEKVELAVMAELLLRGAQTVGELRGRAARMEPIKDLGELQPTLDALEKKKLIVFLTPPGRGSVVTHALYLDRELDKVRREAGSLQTVSVSAPPDTATPADENDANDQFAAIRAEIAALRADFDSAVQQLRQELTELNRQLGN